MPRNSSGTMSLPTGNPVVSGTTISANTQNSTLGDIANEISDSLSRSGKGPMNAPIRTPDGTAAAPAHSFTNETGSGLRRAAAGDVRVAVLGSDVVRFVPGSVDAPGTNAALTLRGNKAGGDSGTDVVVNSQATRTAGNLLSVQNAGADKVLIGYDGKITSAALVSGSLTIGSGGTISPNAGTISITGLAAPSASGDAANKGYVDGPAPTAMSLVNGFTTGSPGTASYWKDASGVVHLTGRITQGGAGGTTVFTTLPAGYRPGVELRFPVARGDSTLTVVLIASTGAASVTTLGGGEIDFLDGISFRP